MRARHRQRPDARPPASERELEQTEATASAVADTAGACAARARESLASLAVRAGSCLTAWGRHGRIRTRCVDRNDLVLFPNHTPLYPIHRFPTNAPSPNVSSVHLKRPRTATTCMHFHHFRRFALVHGRRGSSRRDPGAPLPAPARAARKPAPAPRMIHGGTRRCDSSTVTPHSHRPGRRGGTDRATSRGPPCRRAA